VVFEAQLPKSQFSLPKSMASRRKLKPFRASKEVKRRARIIVGTPPPVRREEAPKLKSPKHKKRDLQREAEIL